MHRHGSARLRGSADRSVRQLVAGQLDGVGWQSPMFRTSWAWGTLWRHIRPAAMRFKRIGAKDGALYYMVCDGGGIIPHFAKGNFGNATAHFYGASSGLVAAQPGGVGAKHSRHAQRAGFWSERGRADRRYGRLP